ncbi:hypothetical protein TARUN_10220 [Trichoderma arundinaceum]|uniref:Uncharacterized protein n=1 Tax=Trichoderma arundinaceum TaxID=490622 RepID=A0A395N8P0_TRIAR|nr:hypothetical protein TARUN_10220 [Trichoderma arundinaceum]
MQTGELRIELGGSWTAKGSGLVPFFFPNPDALTILSVHSTLLLLLLPSLGKTFFFSEAVWLVRLPGLHMHLHLPLRPLQLPVCSASSEPPILPLPLLLALRAGPEPTLAVFLPLRPRLLPVASMPALVRYSRRENTTKHPLGPTAPARA